jgi:hypothetical protein
MWRNHQSIQPAVGLKSKIATEKQRPKFWPVDAFEPDYSGGK